MKISVIMAVFNGQDYLRESISSVCKQSYSNFEFLILNDASTDNTDKIITEFKESDNRIKYIKNTENLGLTKNLNKLIKSSTGDFIARMDADDIAHPDRFLSQMRIFELYPEVECVFTNAVIIDKDSNYICDSWMPKSCRKVIKLMDKFNYIIHPTVIFKKEVLNKVGYYNENYIKGQDRELWLRFIKSDVKFYYLRENLLKYRINPSSVRNTSVENYYYKLSKNCLNNKNKKKAWSYVKYLSFKEKVILTMKSALPFSMYRNAVYVKSTYIHRKRIYDQ